MLKRAIPVLRPLAQPTQCISRRCLATKVHRLPNDGKNEEGSDFRPPWVYTWTRLMSYTIIPSIAVYSIFFYDFGDREHVFQPARRWAAKQKAAFFTLSPAEQKMLEAEEQKSRVSAETTTELS